MSQYVPRCEAVERRAGNLVPAASFLRELLTGDPRYRRVWSAHADRAGGSPNVDAVSRVLVDYLWRVSIDDGPPSPRSLRDKARRALNGEVFTVNTARLFADAFRFRGDDRDRLLGLLVDSASEYDVGDARVRIGGAYRTLSLIECHRIGPDRAPALHRTIHTIEALADDVRYHDYCFDAHCVEVEASFGATAAPVRPHELPGYYFSRLTLDEPMRVGDVRMFEYVANFSYDEPPEPVFRRRFGPHPTNVTMRVEFDAACVPQQISRCEWDSLDGDPSSTTVLTVDAASAAADCHWNFVSSAIVGLRWKW